MVEDREKPGFCRAGPGWRAELRLQPKWECVMLKKTKPAGFVSNQEEIR